MEVKLIIIERDINIHGNLNTELFNILSDIPDNILFYQEHNLRHPLGIYNVSTKRVINALNNFEELLTSFQSDQDFNDLSAQHKELLDSIMAFIDDGYLIMKCFYPKNLVDKDIIFASQWLKKVDENLIEEYQNKLNYYRNKLALIVNNIKHNHARYCHIRVHSKYTSTLGYYIEGVKEGNLIMPHKDIHPTHKGYYTGISYNKDIKSYLVDFYIIASLISTTLIELIKKHHNLNLVINKCSYKENDKLFSLIKQIKNIPNNYFPDEYNINLPEINIENESKIRFTKPSSSEYIKRLYKPKKYQVRVIMSGDGVTRSWALPYFNRQK